jgi:hypothetical protein
MRKYHAQFLEGVNVVTRSPYSAEMKAKALAHCEILVPAQTGKSWRDNPKLRSFLRDL